MADPSLPFFIQRDPDSPPPGASGDAGGIARLQLRGDPGRLTAWLGGARLPVDVARGAPAVVAVELADGRTIR